MDGQAARVKSSTGAGRSHTVWYWIRQDLIAYAFLAPALIGLLLYVIGPAVYGLIVSFTNFRGLGELNFVGLKNYRFALLSDDTFIRTLKVTVGYSAIVVPVQLAIALFFAALLNRRWQGIRYIRAAYFFPYVVPWVAASLVFRTMFDGQIGLVKLVLDFFAVPSPAWYQGQEIGSPAFWMIIIASLWKGVGFTVLVFLAAMQEVPEDLLDAAKVDGANRMQQFWTVTWQWIKPVTIFLLLITFISSMQAFTPFLLMPRPLNMLGAYYIGMTNVAVYAWGQAFTDFRMGYGSALMWILGVILLVCSYLQLRLGVYGLDAEKGG
jgi:multiple sugar transport system permease protein